jgi:hypothetical protein
MKLVLMAVAACALASGQIQSARIALRLSDGEILIIGGQLRDSKDPSGIYEPSMESLPASAGHSPLQPLDKIFRVSPEYLFQFQIDPETKWRPGERWKVYPGAGGPLTAVIDSLAFGYYCGGIGGYAAALGRIEGTQASRSDVYLVAPASGLGAVSENPLVPVTDNRETGTIEKVLLKRGRAIVNSDTWKIDESETAKQMDRAFLNIGGLRFSGRFQRWSVPGRKPLLFVEAVWNDAQGKPLFGGDAVIEEGDEPAVLNFSPKEGQLMRVPETLGVGGWKRPARSIFLNAWSVGTRRFVLIHTQGYEGFSVELMEIIPDKGLVPTGIDFGAGC